MRIRKASQTDAPAGSALLRRSIAELCQQDHGGDPDRVKDWTANKTPATWLSWLDQPALHLFVAEDHGRVAGVCMLRSDGEILLNCVSPDLRFQGVSKAMLQHMEAVAAAAGLAECSLTSTATAMGFYRSAGYAPVKEPAPEKMRLHKSLAVPGG